MSNDSAAAVVGHDLNHVGVAQTIEGLTAKEAAGRLEHMRPDRLLAVLDQLPADARAEIYEELPQTSRSHLDKISAFAEGTIGRLMLEPLAILGKDHTVAEALELVHHIPLDQTFTYLLVVDQERRLVGVCTLRHLIMAENDLTLSDVMIQDPITLAPDMQLLDAIKRVSPLQIPEYPVCAPDGSLIGVVRGQSLFEGEILEITAQPGSMVGVSKEERLVTPFSRSVRFRLPWLYVNLGTAFLAGAVVGLFQETIDRIVLLAMFLPVLAGQVGNTGMQALAVTIRELTLSRPGNRELVLQTSKESFLGLLNGAAVGIPTAVVMYAIATVQGNPDALMLSLIVFLSMTVSCVIGGVCGALIPFGLKRAGADPASASSIFLTTATDVVSMGAMLALATLLI